MEESIEATCNMARRKQRHTLKNRYIPALQGTPEQIIKAEKIRPEKLTELARHVREIASVSVGEEADEVYRMGAAIFAREDAQFWIDNSKSTAPMLLCDKVLENPDSYPATGRC